MFNAFKNLLNNQFSFLKETSVLVAVSGGLDSMVLTHLCKNAGLNFALAHCNFKLRSDESDGDEDFIKVYAENHNLDVFTTHFETDLVAQTTKKSIQMAARQLRYEWFESLQNQHGFEYVLTAHHADDNLETFLINLSRGTGLDGLTGIPEINGSVVRPLLEFSRDEILDFATHEHIKWREDGSNQNTKYLRNKLRHSVIPLLKELNPSFMDRFESTQAHLKDTKSLLEDYMLEVEDRVIESIQEDQIIYNIDKIQSLNNSKAYLFQLLKTYNFTDWKEISSLMNAQSGKQIVSSSHRLLKNRSQLILSKLNQTETTSISIDASQSLVSIPNKAFDLKMEVVTSIGPKEQDVVYLDFKSLKFPLTLRNWTPGDYFCPSGMHGKKKLSKYFKDEKFSLIEKENTLIIYSGDAVVWVIGRRADQRFIAIETSPKILKISILQNANS
mgnify:FL=1